MKKAECLARRSAFCYLLDLQKEGHQAQSCFRAVVQKVYF